MNNLIGKTFKRNKYGLSSWEDTIQEVFITWHLLDRNTRKPEIKVKGTVHTYDLEEIVIINEPLNFAEKMQMDKRDIIGLIQEGKFDEIKNVKLK
jgi:hypothetical protein